MDLGENHSLSFYCHLLLLSKTPICCYCCRGGKMQCLVSSLVRLWFYSIFLGKSSPKTRSLLWEHHQVMSMCRISNQYTHRTRADRAAGAVSAIEWQKSPFVMDGRWSLFALNTILPPDRVPPPSSLIGSVLSCVLIQFYQSVRRGDK